MALLWILGILLLIVLIILAAFWLSPWPTCLLVRFLFRNSPETAPEDYAALQSKVVVKPNLPYGARKSNRLDLYLPKQISNSKGAPLVVWIHGGAFVASDKRDAAIYSTMLAASGYAVASINYSLAPNRPYPAALQETAAALAFLQQMAEENRLDTSRLVLAGDSAGANYAAQFYHSQAHADFAQQLGVAQVVPAHSVCAMLLYCGAYDVAAILNRASENKVLGFFVNKIGWGLLGQKNWRSSPLLGNFAVNELSLLQYPPCFITDGNSQSFMAQGVAYVQALQAQGVAVECLFHETQQYTTKHEYQFALNTPPAQECRRQTLAFLAKTCPLTNNG